MRQSAPPATVLIILGMLLLLPPHPRSIDESRGFMPQMASTLPSSGPVPYSDFEQEVTTADVIIAGSVTAVSETDGPLTLVSPEARADEDQLMVAQVRVLRTLSGNPQGSNIRVLFLRGKLPSRPWRVLSEGQTVLLFLKNTERGYVLTVPTGSTIETLRDIAAPELTLNRTQAVARELEQIIVNADTTSDMFNQAVTARSELSEPVALDEIHTPAMNDPVRRLAWVVVALANQQPEALQMLTELPENSNLRNSELWSQLVRRVSELRQAAAVPDLAQLIQSSNSALARAAVVALRQLHDRSTIPHLVAALDNADQQVRYQAVMGLAELEPGVNGGPAWSVYQSDEQRYLQMWKRWWSEAPTR